MALRSQPVNRWPGVAAAALVFFVTFGTLGVVAWRAEGSLRIGPSELGIIRFTVLQAFLSAAISAGLAIPLARALVRRRFPGKAALITLLGAPFILPVIVAILGLLAVFGRGGVGSGLSPSISMGCMAWSWQTRSSIYHSRHAC